MTAFSSVFKAAVSAARLALGYYNATVQYLKYTRGFQVLHRGRWRRIRPEHKMLWY